MFSKKTCGLPSNRPWTVGDAGPYKIFGIFDILSVGEDIILPSFIKMSLCFARTTDGRPYRIVQDLIFCSWGSILYAPEEKRADMESAPTVF